MIKENLYTTDCIRTFTGIYINVFEPTLEMIDIRDIAHSLSQQPRFGGHLPVFYSVAQHCVSCSYLVDDEHKQAALFHDSAEAYILDCPKPIKKRLTNYNEIEDSLMRLISKKFSFKYPLHEQVKQADKQMLEAEWHELMLKGGKIKPLTWQESEKLFLDRVYEICNHREIMLDLEKEL